VGDVEVELDPPPPAPAAAKAREQADDPPDPLDDPNAYPNGRVPGLRPIEEIFGEKD
jgi:hypothetical protein